MKELMCRWCEFSIRNSGGWECSHGQDPSSIDGTCKEFYCSERDKINGNRNRKSHCFICGKPVYSHGRDTPIYCYEHRHCADTDDAVFDNIPPELMFMLIGGIFTRAREDYIYNANGKRVDAEIFLKSQWAQDLSLVGFSVDELFATLETETEDDTRGTDEDSE